MEVPCGKRSGSKPVRDVSPFSIRMSRPSLEMSAEKDVMIKESRTSLVRKARGLARRSREAGYRVVYRKHKRMSRAFLNLLKDRVNSIEISRGRVVENSE
jgi:hypothetical protein